MKFKCVLSNDLIFDMFIYYTHVKLWKNFKNEFSCFIWAKYEKENTS
jgi:hypothetical protein